MNTYSQGDFQSLIPRTLIVATDKERNLLIVQSSAEELVGSNLEKSLNIEYLEFTGCGNVSYGGAISINNVDIFLVHGCHFINNHVTLYGGAVFVNNAVTMHIEASIFNNNSATAHSDGESIGGAISVIHGCIFTINNIYTNNSADGGGGVIYVESANIYSTNDYYTKNSAIC